MREYFAGLSLDSAGQLCEDAIRRLKAGFTRYSSARTLFDGTPIATTFEDADFADLLDELLSLLTSWALQLRLHDFRAGRTPRDTRLSQLLKGEGYLSSPASSIGSELAPFPVVFSSQGPTLSPASVD